MGATFKKIIDVDSIIKDRVLTQAGLLLGAIGASQAKALCPVDTGDLRGSIEFRPAGAAVEVGTKKEYAAYVEFGTRFQKAQPYLGPSIFYVQQNVKQIVDLCRREVK